MVFEFWNNRLRTGTATTALALIAFALPAAAQTPTILATADQNAVETLAIKLLNSPAVKQQQRLTITQFEAAEPNATPAERSIIRNAVHELAFSAALGAANSDTARPKVVWFATTPHHWFGHEVPGSRWGVDNPDNVYRFITVDSRSKYEITVHPKQPGPLQYSFLLYDNYIGETNNYPGETNSLKALDTPVSGLTDRAVKASPDGSFTITIDADAANGRSNHLQSANHGKILVIRNTFDDWKHQTPLAVDIRRVGGPALPPPPTEAELAAIAADYLKNGTSTLLALRNGAGPLNPAQDNVIKAPVARGGGWGMVTGGHFKLGADQALVLTLNPHGAKYLSVDLTDPWLVSLEHIHSSGNLNQYQAEANKDGSYTYVIAAKDPGIHNWLDTGGLREGGIFIRWQALPPGAVPANGAVKSIKLVNLDELNTSLPAETTKVTPALRAHDDRERAVAYAHRYTS